MSRTLQAEAEERAAAEEAAAAAEQASSDSEESSSDGAAEEQQNGNWKVPASCKRQTCLLTSSTLHDALNSRGMSTADLGIFPTRKQP